MNLFSSGIPNGTNNPELIAIDARFGATPQAAATGVLPVGTQGLVPITFAGVCVLTAAAPLPGLPSAGGNDCQTMEILDTTGHLHTVTFPANTINNTLHVITFGGVVGQSCSLRFYNGKAYINASISGYTLS